MSHGRLIIDPKYVYILDPEPVHVILSSKRGTTNMIKLRALRWGNYLGLFERSQHVPYKRKAGGVLEERDIKRKEQWSDVIEDRERGHEGRNTGSYQIERVKKMYFLSRDQNEPVLLTPWLQPSRMDFEFLISRTVERIICIVLILDICGNWLQQEWINAVIISLLPDLKPWCTEK